ncbi:MAG: TetR/AcrR family transcriptional regulator, partial [Candidatus Geothermincolia bacterium]
MPRKVDKEEKAAAIGQAALKVFIKKGYHHTKMADIAGAAGIGKGTVYEYFQDKAEILKSIFADYYSAFGEGAARAMSGVATPGGRLIALVDFALGHLAEWEDYCAVYIDYL